LRGTQRNENLHGNINGIVKIKVGNRLSQSVLRGHRFQWNFKHLRHPWVKDELSIDPECVRVSDLDRLRNLEHTSQLLQHSLSLNVTNGIDFAKPYTKLLDSNPNPRHAAMSHYKKGSSHQSRGVRATAGSKISQSSRSSLNSMSLSGHNSSGPYLSMMQRSTTGTTTASSHSSLSMPGISAPGQQTSSITSSDSAPSSDVPSPDNSVSGSVLSENRLVIDSQKRKRMQWNQTMDEYLIQAFNSIALNGDHYDWTAIHQLFCERSQIDLSKRELKNRGYSLLRNKRMIVAPPLPVSTALNSSVNSHSSILPLSTAISSSTSIVSLNLDEINMQPNISLSNQHVTVSADRSVSSSDDASALTQPSGPRRNALQPLSNNCAEQIDGVVLLTPPKNTAFTSAEMEVFSFLTCKVSNHGSGIKWLDFHQQCIYRCKRMQLEDELVVYSRTKEQLKQKHKDIKHQLSNDA
jgi:hypothetical protein